MDIKEKIQKLMAKAMSAGVTDAEAESFMNKARELMDRYGLDEAELKDVKNAEECWREYRNEATATASGRFKWHPVDRLLGRTIADFCGVMSYVKKDGEAPVRIFYGLEQEVELTNWILATLKEKFDRDWSNYLYIERKRKSLKTVNAERKSFSLGFANEIARRVDGWSKKNEDTNSNALVVQKKDLARQKLEEAGMQFVNGSAGNLSGANHAGALGAGALSAKSAELGRGVQNRTLAIGSR